jgi:hypothetical protein
MSAQSVMNTRKNIRGLQALSEGLPGVLPGQKGMHSIFFEFTKEGLLRFENCVAFNDLGYLALFLGRVGGSPTKVQEPFYVA